MFRSILYAYFLFCVLLINACLPTIKLCKTESNSILNFPYNLTIISVDGRIIAEAGERLIGNARYEDNISIEQFTIYHNKAMRLCLDPGRHFLEVRFESLMKGSVYIDFDAIAGHKYLLHSKHRVSPVHSIMGRKRIGPLVESSLIPLTWIESWSLKIVDQTDEGVVASADKSSYDYDLWIAKGIQAKGGSYLDVRRVRTPWQILLTGITCPAEGQAFHKEAKAFANSRIHEKELTIHPEKKWHDTMASAWVDVGGKNLNEELVKNGLAWADPRYHKAQKLMKFEEAARKEKIGIWSEPNPVPPWLYQNLAAGREKALAKAQEYSRFGDQAIKNGQLIEAETWFDRSLELNQALHNLVGMAEQYEKLLDLCKTRGVLKDSKEEELYRDSINQLRTMGQQQGKQETNPSDEAFIQAVQQKLKRLTFGNCR